MVKPIKDNNLYITWELNSEPLYINYFKETDTVNFETGSHNVEEISTESLLEAAEIIKEYKALN